MGSSAKKKKEKKKDFQKPKYKVGKAAPKASNFTDTSFKSRAIVMNQQSLSTAAPDVVQQFKHNLSLASSSRNDKQRRDALAYLTSQLSSQPPVNPVGTNNILVKVLPLISDSSTPVRKQLLKLLCALPKDQAKHSVREAVTFIRAGLTHLSADISSDSLGVMEWLLDVAEDELVAIPGGWFKTLKTFCIIMGWSLSSSAAGWTSAPGSGLRAKDAQALARQISTLTRFIQAGIKPPTPVVPSSQDYWDNLYRTPCDPHAFEYMNLFGERRDEESTMYASPESRQGVLSRKFMEPISKGIDKAKKEGGAVGRAAAELDQILTDSMQGFTASEEITDQWLLDLW
ncbi:Rix1 complex component [Trichoderma austrokoningii]